MAFFHNCFGGMCMDFPCYNGRMKGNSADRKLSFGESLKERREALQPPLTQGGLGAVVGVTQSTVAKWEARALPPNRPTAMRALADYFGVSYHDFLDGVIRAGDRPASEGQVPPTYQPARNLDIKDDVLVETARRFARKIPMETLLRGLRLFYGFSAETQQLLIEFVEAVHKEGAASVRQRSRPRRVGRGSKDSSDSPPVDIERKRG